jgi:uncharacterized lipoprotein YddW (UPF0748 family)
VCTAIFALAGNGAAVAQDRARYQAFWVDTFNTRLNDAADVSLVIERARAARANALFVQIRRRGDAWYLNSLEPLPENVAIARGFDPLAEIIARGHAAGLEIHAFATVGPVWNQMTFPSDPRHVFARHGLTPAGLPRSGRDNWLTRTLLPDGEASSSGGYRIGSDFYLDFGHPDAAAYTVNVLAHLVASYDIDGLHLDHIAYPELDASREDRDAGASVGYNDTSLERFRRFHGLPVDYVPPPTDPAWSDWRREQVTALVRRVYLTVASLRPRVKLSTAVAAPGGAPASASDWPASEPMWRVFQDWRAWLEEGIVDLAVPAVFRAEHTPAASDDYAAWTAFARAHRYGRHTAMGIGAYLNSLEGTLRQARRALEPSDQAPLDGIVVYSMGAHNAPVSQNPLALPSPRDTPFRTFDDLAAAFTTSRTLSGQAVETSGTVPLFTADMPTPQMPWKTEPQRGDLKGTVRLADGTAVDGADIALEAVGAPVAESPTRTDGGGFYGRVGIVPGTYRVIVTPDGGSRFQSTCSVTISAGAVANLDLVVDPSRPAVATCNGEP